MRAWQMAQERSTSTLQFAGSVQQDPAGDSEALVPKYSTTMKVASVLYPNVI